MNLRLFVILLVLFASVTAVPAFAQPAPPPPLNEVPLDGLSTLLLAAGAAYGGRRLMKRNR